MKDASIGSDRHGKGSLNEISFSILGNGKNVELGGCRQNKGGLGWDVFVLDFGMMSRFLRHSVGPYVARMFMEVSVFARIVAEFSIIHGRCISGPERCDDTDMMISAEEILSSFWNVHGEKSVMNWIGQCP